MKKALKLHKSIKEQIELLKSRGLIINDDEQATEVLSRINYYRLSGYLHSFKQQGTDKYQDGISFSKISRIYDFDVKLTRLLMFVLEDIEETFKTRFSYTLSSSFPSEPLIYLDAKIYRDQDDFDKFNKLFKDSKKNNKGLPFIQHHYKVYGGDIPIWVAVEIMTMGNLQALYGNLNGSYQKEIAKKYNTGPQQLENWLENITYTRNHLAHFMRIYRYSFGRIPKSCKNHPISAVYSGKIFDQIAIMSFMYSKPVEWNEYVLPEMKELLQEYEGVVACGDLGFPSDWENVLGK